MLSKLIIETVQTCIKVQLWLALHALYLMWIGI
jgi:hypothetical protein